MSSSSSSSSVASSDAGSTGGSLASANAVANSTASGASSSWMGTWKKTLASAARAQSQIGELLSRPGKRYRELSEENAALRRRVEELAPLLTPIQLGQAQQQTSAEQQGSLQVSGPDTIGGLQVVRLLSGSGSSTAGTVLGTEKDAKLLSVHWTRQRGKDEKKGWQAVAGATPGVGFYRTSVDDVDCVLRAQVIFSKLYCRLANEICSENASANQTDPAVEDSAEPASAQSSLSSAPSVASLTSLSSDNHGPLHPDTCRLFAIKSRRIGLSEPVRQAVARLDANEKDVVFSVVNKVDPARKSLLTTRLLDGKMSLVLHLADAPFSNTAEVTQVAERDDAASEQTLELEFEDASRKLGLSVSLPDLELGIFPLVSSETGLALSVRKKGSPDVQRVTVFANSNLERDMIVVFLRLCRSKVAAAASSLDAEAAAQAQRGALNEERRRMLENTSDGTSQVPKVRYPPLVSYDCAYPQVWSQLGYDFDGKPSVHSDSNQDEVTANSGKAEASFASPGKFVKSVSTFLSTALDPLGRETEANGYKSRRSSTSSALSACAATQEATVATAADIALTDEPDEVRPASFDLYDVSGFGSEYHVDIKLSHGEGLGITLSCNVVSRAGTSVSGNNDPAWPKSGAKCVVVSSFCPVIWEGEEIKGKLEESGLIRPGDALVAVNDLPIEQKCVQTVADLETYIPCSLAYVSKLVQRARQSSGTNQKQWEQNFDDDEDDEELASSETPSVRSSGNLACSMRFTFRQGVGMGQQQLVSNENKLRERLEQTEGKLYEANARTSAMFQHCEHRIDAASARITELCEAHAEQRALAEQASIEKLLAMEQVSALRERSAEERATGASDIAALQKRLENAQEQILELRKNKDEAEASVARLEDRLEQVATESKAWVNKIGTKEDAVRALETELHAQQVKQANLEALVDTATSERDRLASEMSIKNESFSALQASLESTKIKLEHANDEADALTSRMRLEQEQAENDLDRARRDCARLTQDLAAAADKLSGTQAHAKALKEANAAAEERASEASSARQTAEAALHQEHEKCVALTQRIGQLQERLRTSGKFGSGNSSTSSEENGQMPVASSSNGSSSEALKETQRQITELEGANAGLRAQVKTMKNKLRSLSAEASKVAELDAVVLEKNDLLVQVQLEKAQRLEAEDELTAYKRALRQTAEQIKRKEAENAAAGTSSGDASGTGASSLWSSRPPIFDHLYKKLVSEERANAANQR